MHEALAPAAALVDPCPARQSKGGGTCWPVHQTTCVVAADKSAGRRRSCWDWLFCCGWRRVWPHSAAPGHSGAGRSRRACHRSVRRTSRAGLRRPPLADTTRSLPSADRLEVRAAFQAWPVWPHWHRRVSWPPRPQPLPWRPLLAFPLRLSWLRRQPLPACPPRPSSPRRRPLPASPPRPSWPRQQPLPASSASALFLPRLSAFACFSASTFLASAAAFACLSISALFASASAFACFSASIFLASAAAFSASFTALEPSAFCPGSALAGSSTLLAGARTLALLCFWSTLGLRGVRYTLVGLRATHFSQLALLARLLRITYLGRSRFHLGRGLFCRRRLGRPLAFRLLGRAIGSSRPSFPPPPPGPMAGIARSRPPACP